MSGSAPIIVVAGSIAAGKTGLVEALGRSLDLRIFRERWDENPWFGGPKRDALASQLWFLLASAADQARAGAGNGGVLERCVHEHARVFAREQLAGEEARLLDDAYAALEASLPDPRLMLYLQAPPAALLARVRSRGRPQERTLTIERLTVLDAAYRELIAGWRRCPVLTIDTERIDLRTAEGRHQVIELARAHLR